MLSDGDNNDLALLRGIVPEDAIGRRCFTFSIGRVNLLTIRTLQAFIFVRIEAGMMKICFHEAERLSDSLQPFSKAFISLKVFELPMCRRREFKLEVSQA